MQVLQSVEVAGCFVENKTMFLGRPCRARFATRRTHGIAGNHCMMGELRIASASPCSLSSSAKRIALLTAWISLSLLLPHHAGCLPVFLGCPCSSVAGARRHLPVPCPSSAMPGRSNALSQAAAIPPSREQRLENHRYSCGCLGNLTMIA